MLENDWLQKNTVNILSQPYLSMGGSALPVLFPDSVLCISLSIVLES